MTKQILTSLMLATLIAIGGASAPAKAHAKTVKSKPAATSKMACCQAGADCCKGGCCDAKAMKAKTAGKKDCCTGGSCCKPGAACCK